MKDLKELFALFGVVAVLVIAWGLCSMTGSTFVLDGEGIKFGNPESFAKATAVAKAGDLSLAATATAMMQAAQATATAVPYQAGRAQTDATAETVSTWAVTLFGIVGGLLLAIAAGSAVVAWLYSRRRIIWVGANGPVVQIGNTLVDTGKAVGPAITVSMPGLLEETERVRHYLKTGEVKPRQEDSLQLTDAGAIADHYLEAARLSSQTNAIGAMFKDSKDMTRKEKLDRVDRGRQVATRRLPIIRAVDDQEELARVDRLFLPEGETE